MKKYCEECGREVETRIITKRETYEVCGGTIEVDAQVLVCADCGEEFYCEELDNATLVNAYNEYRRKHKLLLPEEIKKIREQYGLSQRSFAKLLNCGDKTICRYENGFKGFDYEKLCAFANSVQKIPDNSSTVTGFNVPGFKIGAGFFFMSARTLYHCLGISDSSR